MAEGVVNGYARFDGVEGKVIKVSAEVRRGRGAEVRRGRGAEVRGKRGAEVRRGRGSIRYMLVTFVKHTLRRSAWWWVQLQREEHGSSREREEQGSSRRRSEIVQE